MNKFNNNDSIVISSYYNGDINVPNNTINNVNVTKYPVKLNVGYYKLNTKGSQEFRECQFFSS